MWWYVRLKCNILSQSATILFVEIKWAEFDYCHPPLFFLAISKAKTLLWHYLVLVRLRHFLVCIPKKNKKNKKKWKLKVLKIESDF